MLEGAFESWVREGIVKFNNFMLMLSGSSSDAAKLLPAHFPVWEFTRHKVPRCALCEASWWAKGETSCDNVACSNIILLVCKSYDIWVLGGYIFNTFVAIFEPDSVRCHGQLVLLRLSNS